MSKINKSIIVFSYLLIIVLSGSFIHAQDIIPKKPLINYVTFELNTSIVTIDFNASTSKNISYYNIYTLDIATNPVTGFYLDSVSAGVYSYSYNPGTILPKIYTITAVDKNGNESELGSDYHKPMKLDISYDSCNSAMRLEWDKYIGWKNNLSGYRIFEKKDEEEYKEIQNLIDTTILQFTQNNIEENHDYRYYIEAYNNRGKTSKSNVRHKFTYMPAAPSYLNLDYVSVIDAQTVEVAFTADLSGVINDFRVLRAKSYNGNYNPVQIFQDVTATTTSLKDNVITQGEQYYYKVEALNSCMAPVLVSNTGNNIRLHGVSSGSIITLTWPPYIEFVTGIADYLVYRKNQYSEYILVGTIDPHEFASSGDTITFSEDIKNSGNNTISGEVHYFVEAYEFGTNLLGYSGVSRSNEIKVNVETIIYMPNAFTPNGDGQNDYFIPLFDFVPKEYKMFIYDRSGKLLFTSNDPAIGWDGTMNAKAKAPQGVYIYHIEYLSYNGVWHKKENNGSVTLIHP